MIPPDLEETCQWRGTLPRTLHPSGPSSTCANPKDRLFEELTDPGFFPFWRDESGRAGFLSGKCQVEGEAGKRDHEPVCGVIPTDLIECQLGARRP